MSETEIRRQIAAQILAGFCANPSVFAHNGMSGWQLVNCTDSDLVGYSLSLADRLIADSRQSAAVAEKPL